MNKVLIYVVVAAAVVGGGAYVLTKESDNTLQTAEPPKTLKELMASNVEQTCEFHDETAAAKTAGTVYIAGGKFRGDFTAEAAGKTYVAHSVSDGVAVYTWIDAMRTGFKVNVDAAVSGEHGTEVSSIDINKDVEYSCEPWSLDNSKFQIPSDITFNDLNAMQGAVSAGGGASACGMCDMAPEPQKSQCRAALKC
jgi:hypothetical protein